MASRAQREASSAAANSKLRSAFMSCHQQSKQRTSAVGVLLLGRQRERSLPDVLQVALLDGERPIHQLADRLFARLLIELAEDLPVTDLSGLGHCEELEAVEVVGIGSEVGGHHLRGFVLGL